MARAPRSGLAGVWRRFAEALDDDLGRYAERHLKIIAKDGALVPLRLNPAQRAIHAALERQLAEQRKVRALILKGRQQGASTYVEGRFFSKISRQHGQRAFILGHVVDSSKRLFDMSKRFLDHLPDQARPALKASNAEELVFDNLDSSIVVSTAGSRSPGRSETLQYFHGSEVGFWPNASEHLSGALQAVPDAPGTEVILESTSAGPSGLFYDMCQAAERGDGDYQLVFVPWFIQAEYRRRPPRGFELSDDERDYKAAHRLDLAQMCWRRAKVAELHGVWNFRREYPASAEEAFKAVAPGALWRRELIDGARVHEAPSLRRIVVGIDPSGGAGKAHDEAGIVAAGIDHAGHIYVLDDYSGRMSPDGWGRRAIALYARHRADRIVAEQNFGGEMVEHVIRTVQPDVPVKLVTASRGKQVRAEPIAALYEQGRVHHVGMLAALEDELVTWDPARTQRSPNRLDALVWTATELIGGGFGAWMQFIAEDLKRALGGEAWKPRTAQAGQPQPSFPAHLAPPPRPRVETHRIMNAVDTSNAVTMRAPRPHMSFYIPGPGGRSRQYASDEHGLIHDVATIHIEGLKAHGCAIGATERVHLKRRAGM